MAIGKDKEEHEEQWWRQELGKLMGVIVEKKPVIRSKFIDVLSAAAAAAAAAEAAAAAAAHDRSISPLDRLFTDPEAARAAAAAEAAAAEAKRSSRNGALVEEPISPLENPPPSVHLISQDGWKACLQATVGTA